MSTVDFYFDYASPYAYIANAILKQPEWEEVAVRFRPIYLRGLDAFSSGVPFSPAKIRYFAVDVRRITSHMGLTMTHPDTFPINGLYGLRAAMYCQQSDPDNFATLHDALFAGAWGHNRPIGDKEVVLDIVAETGLDRQAVAEGMNDAAIKDRLKQDTADFAALGGFGVPGFVVGSELFWGHDRLDGVLRAVRS